MKLNINGKVHNVDLPTDTPILWTLRDELGMTGTKFGCGKALCGACTISFAENKTITTIEAVSEQKVGQAVQQAWLDIAVPQCGYCQSGQIVSATALLRDNPKPSDKDIDTFMSGNICRCGTYTRIREAIKVAAKNLETAHD